MGLVGLAVRTVSLGALCVCAAPCLTRPVSKMVALRLAPQLAPLLSTGAHDRAAMLDEGTWEHVARQLRERHPTLAERVLTPSDEIVDGVVLIVNDRVVQRPSPALQLRG